MATDQAVDRNGGCAGPGVCRRLNGVFCLVTMLLQVAATTPALCSPEVTGSFQKGMVLGIFSKTDPGYFRESLREIRNLGADSVSFIIPKVQKDVRSSVFYDDPLVTPSDESLRLATREAHRLGMRVFFIPIVYVEDLKEGEWRGTISPPDWDLWFRRYEKMILPYARLAAAEGVESFSVGSELCSTEGFKDRWRRIIRRIRRVYRGDLTYSANWDHLEPVSFEEDLDFLGMNAYYEIGRDSSSDVESMVVRWREIQGKIRAWRDTNGGKPVVITEVGYPSRAGASIDPWNYYGDGAADEEEQRRCYEAFVRAWKDETILAGVYFYLWWGEGGPKDRDYTPRGKAAQAVIEAWYQGGQWTGKLREPGEVRP